ncbi:alpha-L-fucosidase [Puniceicoccus vermicola]|uniref:alpha-L-fucosidase n=1 Tax=Puniceicoccus vermicola TaxID=388746 RepID=A0A7X1B296_9BACT|nr:alpha-L-fucosidase [Puniceicoccus vermicola]MBC2603238.1 alpha-L-fucosidase [Puniceicoccus vermicola]
MSDIIAPVPSAAQLAWQRSETNAFFHFGLNTFAGKEWGDGSEDPRDFNPTALDCRQWARTARAGGFKVGILTAKHHDGFCLWPSHVTEHSVQNSPWRDGKGDLVREFVDAFRAEGLEVGLYLSPWDRHEPCYGDSERYNDFYCTQLEELLTQYGELREVWFDGAIDEGPNGRKQTYDWQRYFDLVRTLQPKAVTFGDGGTDVRWVGNERGIAGETCWGTVDPNFIRFPGDSGISKANDALADADKSERLRNGDAPNGSGLRVWRPAECDVSIRPGWFYHPEEESEVRTVDNLLDLYFKSVGRNGTLLLNFPITPEGLVHTVDAERAVAFQQAKAALFATDLAIDSRIQISNAEAEYPIDTVLDAEKNSYWTPGKAGENATLMLRLPEERTVSIVSLEEAIEFGQLIAKHRIELQDDSRKSCRVIEGTTVGCKRLHRVDPILCSTVKLTISKSYGESALAALRLY